MDDESIVSLYFSRSESAIRETEAKYGPAISDCAYNILLSRRDTEECVNDAYLGAWNSIPPARPASLRAYLLKITRNIAISRLRQNLAKKRSRELEISLSELEDVLPACPPDLSPQELGELLNEFLAGLGRDARTVFLRKYWFFDSVADISARTGFSEAKIKTSLHRTRERLREFLTDKGVAV